MKHSRYLIGGCLLAAISMVCACSDTNGEHRNVPSIEQLPNDLQWMNGTWGTVPTGSCPSCEVVIEGYTLRLSYRPLSEARLFKKNTVIRAVDEKRHLLLMHDGGAWGYGITKGEEGKLLELEFYNNTDADWTRIKMKPQANRRLGRDG